MNGSVDLGARAAALPALLLDFLASPRAKAMFEQRGFTVLP